MKLDFKEGHLGFLAFNFESCRILPIVPPTRPTEFPPTPVNGVAQCNVTNRIFLLIVIYSWTIKCILHESGQYFRDFRLNALLQFGHRGKWNTHNIAELLRSRLSHHLRGDLTHPFLVVFAERCIDSSATAV